MKFTPTQLVAALGCTAILALTACGGGGGGTASGASPVTLSVTSATGAAFTGATITVTDRTGAVVGTSGTVGADGLSTITLSAGAAAPFVLTATRTSADGATESMVSVVPTASTTTSVNITPITNLIASRLSPSGDPTKLASEVGAGTATVTTSTVSSTVTDVQAILQPLITAVGAGAAGDPLTGTFSTDGTGYDRLLDSVKVTIIPASATTTNVEIGIKQQQAEGAAPVAVQFNNGAGQTAASSVTIPAITAGDLLPSGTSAKIAAHLAQLTTCYALASTARVSGTTAASVSAPECQQVFYSNDASTYRHGGKYVNSTEAFSSLFNANVQNLVFSQGNYEFTRADGSIVISYKSRTATGAETFDTFVLKEDTDGKLKQYGNRYDFGGGISAYHQIRRFPTLSQSASDYYSTGYNISIPKNAAYDYVAVTTPRGNRLVYMPQSGFDNLQLVKGWTGTADNPDFTNSATTGTSFVRIRSEYADEGNTSDPAATSDGNRLFFAPTPFTNAEIAQIPAQGVWTFKYYQLGGYIVGTQYYKTRSRALTIPELRAKAWAALTSAEITALQTASITPAGASGAGQIPITDSRTSIGMAYTVPTGALPPTSLQVWGKYSPPAGNWGNAPSFSDAASVASTARSGSIACANSGGSDTHCSGAAYVNPTRATGAHLWSKDPFGREFASFYALYQL